MSAHDVFFVQSPAPDRVDKKVRNALVHDSSAVGRQVNATLQRIVDELIEPFYQLQIDYWERPEIIVYPPGGFYAPHNDGEDVVHDAERFVWEWRRSIDRDISVVWYWTRISRAVNLCFQCSDSRFSLRREW